MSSSNNCFFGLLHVHTGAFFLTAFLVSVEIYAVIFELYKFIAYNNGKQMGPNMTVHEYVGINVDHAGRFFAEQVLYGNGKVRFVVQYASLFLGLLVHICFLIGNRMHLPKLYLPAIYFSGVAILCMICESIQHIMETIKVYTNRYDGFIPQKPVEVKNYVIKTLLSYFFVNLIAMALTIYLLCLMIKAKKYLESEKSNQVHPVVVTNEPESEWNVDRV